MALAAAEAVDVIGFPFEARRFANGDQLRALSTAGGKVRVVTIEAARFGVVRREPVFGNNSVALATAEAVRMVLLALIRNDASD